MLLYSCDGFGEPGKHFPVILQRLEILAVRISEVADEEFFWKVLISELLKIKLPSPRGHMTMGFISLLVIACTFLHYSSLG